jgi:tetratricopeptide (TPR) repeat protein
MRNRILVVVSAAALCAFAAAAQISGPPSGNNQRQTVIQQIGPVKVSIDYSSPHVHSPQGEDRHGKIWGDLVPWGTPNLGFGSCKECPWRAGANENTVFTTSHDIQVEGKTLPAGSYGFFIVPAKDADWTAIFSRNHTSWGSYFYDPAEDVLRVAVKPEKSDYHEVLSYEFPERKNDAAVMALRWEDLSLPLHISVPNATDLYIQKITQELRTEPGFSWRGWQEAARYALENKHPAEALTWAETAVKAPNGIGQENYATLSTLADAYDVNNKAAESKAARDKALSHPTATVFDVHQYGRQLMARGKKEDALAVFQLNAKLHPNVWPTNWGLARAYSAVGKYPEALKYAKLALAQAPDDANRKNIESGIKKLEQGKDLN